jgi:paired amphipathic helix protein Sin3a
MPNAALDKSGTLEELDFFEKVKKVLGNKTTYNEFLKILNLFSQELIDSKTLVERVEAFLSKSPELFDWFKKFVRYEGENVICKSFFLNYFLMTF